MLSRNHISNAIGKRNNKNKRSTQTLQHSRLGLELLEKRLCLNGTAEIHGMKYDASFDPGEQPLAGVKVYLDSITNGQWDETEPWAITDGEGEYVFEGLDAGLYTVAEVVPTGYEQTFPTSGTHAVNLTAGTTVENIDFGNMPTIPEKVDVFMLGDGTGSFGDPEIGFFREVNPIIEQLVQDYPNTSWGFGVGRFLEYANFDRNDEGRERPFILNQPIIEYADPVLYPELFKDPIEAARLRQPEWTGIQTGGYLIEPDVEALFQVATGFGFDGNYDGDTTDSGPAGLYTTQTEPGISGDVPAFDSFQADPSHDIIDPAGTLGGVGFREGATPIVLIGTDAATRYEPEDIPLGPNDMINGVRDVEYGRFTVDGEPLTPGGTGAQIQETVDALNALGIRVIGLGEYGDYVTYHPRDSAPRSMLEAFAEATGAIYYGDTPLENGTTDEYGNPDPIDPGEPLYFSLEDGYSTLPQDLSDGIISQLDVRPGFIAGNIWNDMNYDGIHDAVESGLTGVTVFLDHDGDGILDSGEYQISTDASGDYLFDNLVPNTYEVRVVVPAGQEFTTPDYDNHQQVIILTGWEIADVDFGLHEITAVDDSFFTDEDVALDIAISTLMANDSTTVPSTGNPVSFYDFSQPENGAVAQDGLTLWYTPNADWYGVDTFTYQIADGQGYYDLATVTITVNPVNDAPRALRNQFRMLTNESISDTIGTSDPEGDSFTQVLTVNAVYGNLEFDNVDGSFTYEPLTTVWTGVDRFTITVDDGTDSSEETVAIYVCSLTDTINEPVVHSDSESSSYLYQGGAVAISGDTFIVGSKLQFSSSSSVFIYREASLVPDDPTDTQWEQVTELSTTDEYDEFGCSVAISGYTSVVGARLDDDNGSNPTDSGAAYVYADDGSGWAQFTTLTAVDAEDWDHFGTSVAIDEDGDTIVIGAPGCNVGGIYGAGAVYVFQFNENEQEWQWDQTLTASDPSGGASFGNDVDISGEKIIVGASRDTGNKGAAYIFEYNTTAPGDWSQSQKITADDGLSNDFFGCSAAIDGSTVVVGASEADISGVTDAGAAYLFEYNISTGAWEQENKLTLDIYVAHSDWFGASVDILGDEILVGTPGRSYYNNIDAGIAYLINKNDLNGGWETSGALYATSGTLYNQQLGKAVALGNRGVLAGAPYYNSSQGGAYLFAYDRTPAAEDLEFSVSEASITDYMFGIDPFEGDDVVFSVTDTPDHGDFSYDQSTGSFTYTPDTTPTAYNGVDSFTYKVNDGNADSNTATVMLIVGDAPVVLDVQVHSSSEDTTASVETGENDCSQLYPVQIYGGIDEIRILFDRDITADVSDLELNGHEADSYSFNSQTNLATWTFTTNGPWHSGEMVITLYDAVNINGLALDGEWVSPEYFGDVSGNSTFDNNGTSGDGAQGGDFTFNFSLLPGDANSDGKVDVVDLGIVATNYGQAGVFTWSDGDFTGDGLVDVDDLGLLGTYYNNSVWQPPAPLGMMAVGGGFSTPTLTGFSIESKTASALDKLFEQYDFGTDAAKPFDEAKDWDQFIEDFLDIFADESELYADDYNSPQNTSDELLDEILASL